LRYTSSTSRCFTGLPTEARLELPYLTSLHLTPGGQTRLPVFDLIFSPFLGRDPIGLWRHLLILWSSTIGLQLVPLLVGTRQYFLFVFEHHTCLPLPRMVRRLEKHLLVAAGAYLLHWSVDPLWYADRLRNSRRFLSAHHRVSRHLQLHRRGGPEWCHDASCPESRPVGNLWTKKEDWVGSGGDDDHGMRDWRRRSRVAHQGGGEGGEGGETKVNGAFQGQQCWMTTWGPARTLCWTRGPAGGAAGLGSELAVVQR